jgi:formyltetrahydrofolate deformylase
MNAGELILTLSCPDRRGIVYAIARAIADGGGNIVDSQQFGDPDEGVFFMRVHFADDRGTGHDAWRAAIAPVADEFAMRWELHEGSHRPRILVAVSREGHCLNDLLYRWRSGAIAGDVVGVVSTLPDHEALVASYGVPYHVLPARSAMPRSCRSSTRSGWSSSSSRATCRSSAPMPAASWPAARSTSITLSCPRSRAPARTRRRTPRGEADRSHRPTTSPSGSTRGRSSSRRSRASITRTASPSWPAWGATSSASRSARAVRWHVEHRVLLHGDRTVVFR